MSTSTATFPVSKVIFTTRNRNSIKNQHTMKIFATKTIAKHEIQPAYDRETKASHSFEPRLLRIVCLNSHRSASDNNHYLPKVLRYLRTAKIHFFAADSFFRIADRDRARNFAKKWSVRQLTVFWFEPTVGLTRYVLFNGAFESGCCETASLWSNVAHIERCRQPFACHSVVRV